MNPMMKNMTRTAIPAIVGAVATYITKQAAHIDPTTQAIVFPIATTAYYAIIRLLEEKFPKAGWLLGALPQSANSINTTVAQPTNGAAK